MNTIVIVFLRYPRPGKVKTRLAASIGHEQAAAFYKQCVERLMGELARLPAEIAVVYYFVDDDDRSALRSWMGPDATLRPQTQGDLGVRMQSAFTDVFADGAARAVIVGTDVPDLTAEIITGAFAALDASDVVIGPSNDGGYYLLGMNMMQPLFDGIGWSTMTVALETVNTARALGLRVAELEHLDDIDTGDDYRRWCARTATA